MTMSTSLLEVVEHYQKKVERYSDEDKILHCFSKLHKLPITVEVLSQTGVGKTVNAFRRDPGPVGLKSRELVSKWKRIFEENEQKEKRLKAERSSEQSVEPSASPAASDASEERMEIDEARMMEEQRERAEAEEAEAERREEEQRQAEAQAAAEAERRARDEEKRRRREERARREEAAKEGHRHHSSKERHSTGSKHERHGKESKHRRHDAVRENGYDAEPLAAADQEQTESRTNGRSESERSHHNHHRSSSKHTSSGEKYASSSDKQGSPSDKHASISDKHSSSSDKRPSSSDKYSSDKHSYGEKHSSKDRHRLDDASPSKSHHKSRANGSLDADHSSSSKKSSLANGEGNTCEERRSKHKSKREKRSSKAEKEKRKEPARLREVDFLCQPSGGNDSGGEQEGSFADALGGSDAIPKKKKKKSKSSSSHAPSSASSAPVPGLDASRPPPPPPPPPPSLEVLDVLPEISAHYRPLPRPAAPARPPGKRTLDEEEALAAVLGAKNKRTKVYSGARSVGWSRVPALVDICLRSLVENIEYLEYTGGVPYEILRPVLEKCSATQLRDIEYYNPYLMEDTDALWEVLVKKEFKCERREEMETWREMHARCSEEREQKYNKLRSMIEGKRKESLASSRKTKVAYEHTFAKPPRNIARKQAKNGTAVTASLPSPAVMASGGSRPPRPAPGTDPTSRPAAPSRTAAPPKKKAPLMAKVLRAMGRR